MEMQVSPLLKVEESILEMKPTWDDPYAFVESIAPLTKHDYHYIDNKINMGWITDRDIDIVRFLAVHRWITIAQLTSLFFPGTESTSSTIRSRVNKLQKYGLIRKIKWVSHTNMRVKKPSIYELGSSGADILKYRLGVFLGSRDPRRLKEITMLFRQKYIVANEFYIQIKNSFNLVFFEFHPVLEQNQIQVVPMAQFILSNPSGRKIPFLLLCYRDEEKWMKTIRYQAGFLKKYFATEGKTATIIVLTSTEEKAKISSSIIEQEGLSGHTWFITDDELYRNNEGITKSFFVYQNGEKIYFDLG